MKKEDRQPQTEVVLVNGDTLMEGEWWSVHVDPNEEIEDDDIGAKQGAFNDNEDWPSYNPWED